MMTLADALSIAIESLNFSEQRFRDYEGYPSPEFQRERIKEAQEAKRLLRKLRKNA